MTKVFTLMGGRNTFLSLILYVIGTALILGSRIDFLQWSDMIIWIYGIFSVGSVTNDAAGVIAKGKTWEVPDGTEFSSASFFSFFGGRNMFYGMLALGTAFILFAFNIGFADEATAWDQVVKFVKYVFAEFIFARTGSAVLKAVKVRSGS